MTPNPKLLALRDPVVWLLEQSSFDYSPARVFAEKVIPIHAARLTPNVGSDWNERVLQQLRAELRDYRAGHDFIIPTGNPVRMVLAAMVLREHGDTHQLLGWDARVGHYHLYTLDLAVKARTTIVE